MQYMGSKNKLAKDIIPIILKDRKEGQWYVEPFVGGCNMIDKVDGNRIGNDSHYYLIEMWKALQNGWIPPSDITKEDYYELKSNPDKYIPEVIGFVGFLCSFGGKWWGGYAANSKGENYAARGSRIMIKQIDRLKGVMFLNQKYSEIEMPNNSIIYCDPPYEGTTAYKDKFNNKIFWQWCRDKTKEGHQVFISEYNAPDDFECILEINHKTILDKNSQKVRVEKLFRLKQ